MAEHPAPCGMATEAGAVTPPAAYAVVIEAGSRNYSACVPDLPGCIATGQTIKEVTARIRRAITIHLEGMRRDGEPIPAPTTRAIEVAADDAA
jgi:predicted RNase H-like HicB family nuclease